MNSEGFFNSILDQLYDGVYLTDLDRRILFWNKAAERITGYLADEVLGKKCLENI
ncbi:PAS domain S-box protein [bacterium]|nr:PAS domain S-box protein [bacterium]